MIDFFAPAKYLFYHIPKTGGTTLTAWMDQFFDADKICPRTFFHPGALFATHLTAKQKKDIHAYQFIRGHFFFNIASSLRGKTHSLTFLRDPQRRVISQYEHLKRTSDAEIHQAVINEKISSVRARSIRNVRNISLQEFLRNLDPEFKLLIDNTQSKTIINAFSKNQQKVSLINQNLLSFSFFGIMELFDLSLQLLCYQFGWICPDRIQPLNQHVTPGAAEDISDETKELIEPYIAHDRLLYSFAQKEFLSRYRGMVRALMRQASYPEQKIESAVRNPFTQECQSLMIDLLKKNFQRHSRTFFKQHPHLEQKKGNKTLSMSMSQAMMGRGWLEREGAEDAVLCRWSGPGTESDCWVKLTPNKAYLFSAVILEVLHAQILDELKIIFNKVELSLEREFLKERSARVKACIPASAIRLDGVCRIQFRVPFTVSHQQYCGVSDKRKKGIRLAGIYLTPLEADQEKILTREV